MNTEFIQVDQDTRDMLKESSGAFCLGVFWGTDDEEHHFGSRKGDRALAATPIWHAAQSCQEGFGRRSFQPMLVRSKLGFGKGSS